MATPLRLSLGASGALILAACGLFAQEPRPLVKIELGQLLSEFRSKTEYKPFREQCIDEDGKDIDICQLQIADRYDLSLSLNGKELQLKDIGGSLQFGGGITVGVFDYSVENFNQQPRHVNAIHFTPQNRLLTIDEAIAFCKSFEKWMAEASKTAKSDVRMHSTARIEQPEFLDNSLDRLDRYEKEVKTYEDVRREFLDGSNYLVKISGPNYGTRDDSIGIGVGILLPVRARLIAKPRDQQKLDIDPDDREFLVTIDYGRSTPN